MDVRLREIEEVEEEVSVFMPWKLMLRCATDSCWIGLKTGAWAFRDESPCSYCSYRIIIENLSSAKLPRISCPCCVSGEHEKQEANTDERTTQ